MREEYDFSKGKRGLRTVKKEELHLPVYLAPEVELFYNRIASKKNSDLSSVINSILKKDMELNDLLQ